MTHPKLNNEDLRPETGTQQLSSFRLDDEVVVITGGGTGLGLAIAKRMHDAGAIVVILGRRESVLRESCEMIGERAEFRVHDVCDSFAKSEELVSRISCEIGSPSILVNNAGIHLKKSALETTEEEIALVTRTHVGGSLAMVRATAHDMVKREKGAILFIVSMASLFGIPQVCAYTAAKSAQLGLMRCLAVELSPSGVRVNAIAPGWIDTEMTRKAMANDPQRFAKVIGRTPMQRFGDPNEVAHAAVFLCSPAASFITGSVLAVDGGASIGF